MIIHHRNFSSLKLEGKFYLLTILKKFNSFFQLCKIILITYIRSKLKFFYRNNLLRLVKDTSLKSIGGYSQSQLQTEKFRYKKYRDFAVIGILGVYMLNIIDANVDALWAIGLDKSPLAQLDERGDLLELGGRQRAQRVEMPVRHDHQMAVVVRVTVQDDVTRHAFMDDERVGMRGAVGVAEDATG